MWNGKKILAEIIRSNLASRKKSGVVFRATRTNHGYVLVLSLITHNAIIKLGKLGWVRGCDHEKKEIMVLCFANLQEFSSSGSSFEGFFDGFLINFVGWICLNDLLDTGKGFLEAVKRGRIYHFLFDPGRIRAPTNQKQTGPIGGFSSLCFHNIFIVIDGVAAVIGIAVFNAQVVEELVVIVVAVSDLQK